MQLSTSEKIVIYRHRNQLTQATLADLVHMSTSTLARIESGSRPVTLDELSAIAKVLRIPISELLPDN